MRECAGQICGDGSLRRWMTRQKANGGRRRCYRYRSGLGELGEKMVCVATTFPLKKLAFTITRYKLESNKHIPV